MKPALLLFCGLISIPAFALKTYNVVSSGAVGNGSTVNTTAIQTAIDSCTVTGGVVEVPSGTFVTGTIILKNNVNLQIDSGAVLEGSGSISDYPSMTKSFSSAFFTLATLIYADSASNIAITGKGTINGNGSSIAFLLSSNKSKRPFGIWLVSCRNVQIKNVTLENSAYWMLHPMNCDSVAILNITISNHANSNNDGIDVDGCRNVWITGCNIDAFDDAISPKTTFDGTCSNVTIKHCNLASWSNDIRFGTESWGTIKNLLMDSCTFKESTFSGSSPATAGINMGEENGGSMDSITISNITMTGVATPMVLRLEDQGVAYSTGIPFKDDGTFSNVTIENITATASSNITSTISGVPNTYMQNIALKNIAITFPGGFPAVRSSFVLPEDSTVETAGNMYGDTIPAYGFYVRHVKNISMENVCFTYLSPDKRPILYFTDVLSSTGLPIDTSAYKVSSGGVNTNCIDTAVLGVNNIVQQNSDIRVYPNPSKGIFDLLANSQWPIANSRVEIYNVLGEKVYMALMPQTPKGALTTIDLSNQNVGVYFYRIISAQGEVLGTGKLVIE